MSESRKEQIENTHDAMRLFYTVILTIALSEGLLKFINTTQGTIRSIDSFSLVELAILFIFLLFTSRFFLGGVRHLDARYDEMSLKKISPSGLPSRFFGIRHYVGLDILLLSLDAFILLYIGSSIRIADQFFIAIILLLANDAVWGLLIVYLYDLFTEAGKIPPEVIWSINNFAFAVLFLISFYIFPDNRVAVFIPLAILNSAVDFYFTWEFYFPF